MATSQRAPVREVRHAAKLDDGRFWLDVEITLPGAAVPTRVQIVGDLYVPIVDGAPLEDAPEFLIAAVPRAGAVQSRGRRARTTGPIIAEREKAA